jgi:hypothetical protein
MSQEPSLLPNVSYQYAPYKIVSMRTFQIWKQNNVLDNKNIFNKFLKSNLKNQISNEMKLQNENWLVDIFNENYSNLQKEERYFKLGFQQRGKPLGFSNKDSDIKLFGNPKYWLNKKNNDTLNFFIDTLQKSFYSEMKFKISKKRFDFFKENENFVNRIFRCARLSLKQLNVDLENKLIVHLGLEIYLLGKYGSLICWNLVCYNELTDEHYVKPLNEIAWIFVDEENSKGIHWGSMAFSYIINIKTKQFTANSSIRFYSQTKYYHIDPQLRNHLIKILKERLNDIMKTETKFIFNKFLNCIYLIHLLGFFFYGGKFIEDINIIKEMFIEFPGASLCIPKDFYITWCNKIQKLAYDPDYNSDISINDVISLQLILMRDLILTPSIIIGFWNQCNNELSFNQIISLLPILCNLNYRYYLCTDKIDCNSKLMTFLLPNLKRKFPINITPLQFEYHLPDKDRLIQYINEFQMALVYIFLFEMYNCEILRNKLLNEPLESLDWYFKSDDIEYLNFFQICMKIMQSDLNANSILFFISFYFPLADISNVKNIIKKNKIILFQMFEVFGRDLIPSYKHIIVDKGSTLLYKKTKTNIKIISGEMVLRMDNEAAYLTGY